MTAACTRICGLKMAGQWLRLGQIHLAMDCFSNAVCAPHSTAELQYKVRKVLDKCQLTLYTECPPAPDLIHWCVTVTLSPQRHAFVQHKQKAQNYNKHHKHLHVSTPSSGPPMQCMGVITECPPAPDPPHWCVTVTLSPHKDDTKHMSVYWTRYWSTFHCQHSTLLCTLGESVRIMRR